MSKSVKVSLNSNPQSLIYRKYLGKMFGYCFTFLLFHFCSFKSLSQFHKKSSFKIYKTAIISANFENGDYLMKKLFSLFALTAIFAIAAFADIRLPDTPKPAPKGKQVEMFVDVTSEVSEPTLVIKKSSSKLLRAALDEAEGIDGNLAQTESAKPNFTASSQTVVGGIFLTLAFVFGGVWIARSKPSKTVVSLFLAGVFATGSVLVFANIAPPQRLGINKNILSQEFYSGRGATARGKVRVKIVNDSTAATPDIKLLIPMNSENNEE